MHALYSPRAAQIQKEAKTAKMMVLILGVHMLSLIPYLVVVTMRYFVEEEGALSDAKKVKAARLPKFRKLFLNVFR